MIPKTAVNIGMLGLGTVGSGTYKILQRNYDLIAKKVGAEVIIKKILVRDLHKKRAVAVDPSLLTDNPAEILQDDEIDIVVEVMGGIDPARSYIEQALKRGRYVVTANKDLIAQAGGELLRLAKEYNSDIFYEASVGGGIPLVRPLKRCLAANRITRLIGIINGTTNYILTKMSLEEMEFDRALAEAQDRGFAETDPRADLEGKDAAYKLAILAGIAFNSQIDMEDIHTEGINGISKRDILYARELGFTIKLLAVGEDNDEGLFLRVHPALIPLTHPLAAVYYEFNALFLEGDAVGEVMFYGRGAGEMPTGSAVVADIIELARNISRQVRNGTEELRVKKRAVLPVEQLVSRFYLRLRAKDQPGVFASLATAFGDEGVSLDMIIQKRSMAQTAEVVLVTHDVKEKYFNRALGRIQRYPSVKEINSVIRVINGD